ncbi:MAG: hypothetical protein RL701_5279, partial [Pseudomonadota bacterium]
LRRPRMHSQDITAGRLRSRPSLFSRILRGAFATVGMVATGLLVYAAERRARGHQLLALPENTDR